LNQRGSNAEANNQNKSMAFCWYYKKLIARCLDADEAPSEALQNHMRACPDCQAFYESEKHLTESLVAGADLERRTPSPFLQARIIAALTKRDDVPEPRVFRFNWVAAAFVGLLVVGGILVTRHLPIPGTPSTLVDNTTGNAAFFSTAGIPSGQKLLEWSQALDQPLETELNSVVNDAKSAIRLLADNFLPEKHLAVSLPER
jgi:hypothetical protein